MKYNGNKMKIDIVDLWGKVLFSNEEENNTFKDTLIKAVKDGANLSEADLSGANLYGANLYGADLRGADLYAANLSEANLYEANLIGADLRGANLYGANLSGADLYGANLYGANLSGADLIGAKNKEKALMPLFCKWSLAIKGNTLHIGCKEKTFEKWDSWFNSTEQYDTTRGTNEFKQIQAMYLAYKAYYKHMSK